MASPISDIVSVSSQIVGSAGVSEEGFGQTLFATSDNADGELTLDGDTKVKTYRSLTEVGNDYSSGDEPYLAASSYFAQVPYPKPFKVGYFPTTARSFQIVGGAASGAAATLVALTGTQNLTIGSTNISLATVVALSSGGGADVAAALQTDIRAATETADIPNNSNWTVTYQAAGTRYIIDTGLTSNVPHPIAFPSGTHATTLAWTSSTATAREGVESETAAQFMAEVQRVDDDWYFFCCEDSMADSGHAETLAAAVQGTGSKFMILDTRDSEVLSSTSGRTAVTISGREYERVAIIYSSTKDYKSCSLAGRFSAVNFGGIDTVITAKFKSLPGTTRDVLSRTELSNLNDLRINHYTPFGATPIVAEGYALKPGIWSDVRYWLDWFTHTVQNRIYNLLRTSGRIAQSDTGAALVQNVVEGVCLDGVDNGGIAPGIVSEAIANNIRSATGSGFDGNLINGYVVHVDPVSELSDSDLGNREIPQVQVWFRGSGAIHSVDVDLVFN